MSFEQRVSALQSIKRLIDEKEDKIMAAVEYACHKNQWFTPQNCWQALDAIATNYLSEEVLLEIQKRYNINPTEPKSVGLVCAANIPLVGFHDILSIFLSGHVGIIKLSDRDEALPKFLIKQLMASHPGYASSFTFVDKLKNIEAVIATGSDNSARYFEYYFGKYPNIIRKNRNGVAVLTGKESKEELENLRSDIFSYFGMGCRNVSKIYVPESFDFKEMMEVLHDNNQIVLHPKYKNNFDYNIALCMLNQEQYYNNGGLIVKEQKQIASRIACLHYEKYQGLPTLENELLENQDQIQCVVGNVRFSKIKAIPFGKAQSPEFFDYADGVDVFKFLTQLN